MGAKILKEDALPPGSLLFAGLDVFREVKLSDRSTLELRNILKVEESLDVIAKISSVR